MDGKVIIGTALDSKQLDKDLKNEQAKLKQFEKENQILIREKGKAESELKEYYQLRDAIKQATDSKMQMADEEELIVKYLAREEEQINNLNDAYSTQLSHLDEINKKIQENELQQGLTKNNIDIINQKLENTKDFGSISESIKSIGSSTEGIVKKVVKWGLAVFGVRSAYMFIRQAMSTLSQYDDKLAIDIQYIRYALASVLKPIIETIINLVYKLLAYIGYIAKAWFGVNIFANASAKAFKKVNSGIKDTNKSAQKLQKTLAGFDEMNILQKDGSISNGGGGGGVSTPSMDLSNFENIEIPEWVQWIADNGKLLKDIIIGIGLAFATWKITQLAFGLSGIGTSLPTIFGVLKGMSGLQIFGIIGGVATAVVGIYETIKGLIKWFGDPTWENFEDVLSGLETVLIGVGIAMVTINASNPIGWITLAIGAIPKLIGWLKDLNEEDEEHIKQTKTMKEAEEDLAKTRKALKSATQNYKNATKEAKKAEKELAEIEKKHKISGKDLYDQVITGQLTYDKMTKSQKEVYEAYLNNLDAQGNLKTATEKMQQATIDERNAIEDLSVSTYKYKGQYSDYVKTILDNYDKQKIGAEEMASKIMYVMSEMDKDTREKFAIGLPKSVKDGFLKAQNELGYGIRNFSNGVKISFKDVAYAGESATKRIGDAGKSVADKLSKQFGTTIPNNIQKSIDKINTLTQKLGELGKSGAVTIATTVRNITGKGNAKGAIYYPPKLAVGGIINQPGRGVPLAMGGERGAEGVIPLTDSQQMNLLGEAIGKYITVNATIVNQMNGRVISRELKQIQNDEDFAFNGG